MTGQDVGEEFEALEGALILDDLWRSAMKDEEEAEGGGHDDIRACDG